MLHQCSKCRDSWRTRAMHIGVRARTLWPWGTQHLWLRGGKWWWWWTLWHCGPPRGSKGHGTAESEAWAAYGPGRTSSRGPQCDWVHHVSTIYSGGWSTRVRSFSKCTGNPWQHGFCDFVMQGWAQQLWGFLYVLTERNRGMECKISFWKCEDPQRGPELAGVPPGWRGWACGRICSEVYCKGCVLRFRKV